MNLQLTNSAVRTGARCLLVAAIAASPGSSGAIAQTAAQSKAADIRAVDSGGCRDGYRRQGTIHDYALRRTWLVYASCTHPEMPLVAMSPDQPWTLPVEAVRAPLIRAVQLQDAENSVAETAVADGWRAAPEPPAIASGSKVRLWREDKIAKVNLVGIALESGVPGSPIRVRLVPGGKVLRGTVREAGSVEMDVDGGGFGREGQ